MNKFAIVTTVSDGYMFALNANFNTNKHYGTNADYHVIYHDAMSKDYMDACTEAFKDDFEIHWVSMSSMQTDFHNSKYAYAKGMHEYDCVCLIDADLFIVTNLNEYFQSVANSDRLISAQHLWSGGLKESLFKMNWADVVDRQHAQFADFPLFISPVHSMNFLQDWYDFTQVDPSAEISHPLVACNRAIAKHFDCNTAELLDGHAWVADKDFWNIRYHWNRHSNDMHDQNGKQICAVHNKWWKEGRANGEFRAHIWVQKTDPKFYPNLLTGEHNFNEIKDMMAFFNDMTPATRREDYLQEKIVMTDIIEHLK